MTCKYVVLKVTCNILSLKSSSAANQGKLMCSLEEVKFPIKIQIQAGIKILGINTHCVLHRKEDTEIIRTIKGRKKCTKKEIQQVPFCDHELRNPKGFDAL